VDSPLAGLRVLDLSRVAAGPFAGRMLADLGADVVKLEPPQGDVTRVWGEERHGLSGFYTQHNVGKRNICIDLTVAGAADVVIALAAQADMFIENFRPDVLPRLGLGWDVLHAANPRLIMLSISGFGASGPEAGRAAFAPVIHAEAGLIRRQADFDGDTPSDPMLSIADYNAALHGLVGLLAALHMREQTGVGQHVEIAMIDSMLVTDEYAHHFLDESPVERLGGLIWETVDGPLLVAGTLRNTWKVLSSTYAIPDTSPAGADLPTKIEHRHRAVAAWFMQFGSHVELVAALDKAGLAWAPLRTTAEAFARRPFAIAEVDDRGGGVRRVVQSPYRFSEAAAQVRGGAPHMGEHNRAVLADWVGWDTPRIDALEAAGILRTGRR
jgi:crotonobetainyl-CoA:carnitine CoA-transferase CaiB-like acyl-CoA transferase